MRPLRIVVIDDEPSTSAFLKSALTAEGHLCHDFLRAAAAEEYLAANDADLVLVDIYLGAESGIDLVRRLRALQPDLYVVMMTAHASLETAARSAVEGAVDYVGKPITLEQLKSLCERADYYRMHRSSVPSVAVQMPEQTAIIGKSSAMVEIYNVIARVAPSNVNVLITGPSGSGKELVARAIHQHSKRAHAPFTPVNCGSMTETLLESELFGHEKGAFTGATEMHKGLIETSNGGTLFLDEIADTTTGFQAKLLRVIQEQEVRRVGSNKYISIDVRFVAATNRDLPALIKAGQFREDLYFRLSAVQILIPPLNERREDIPLLVQHFLRQFNAKNQRQVTIEFPAIEALQARDWPGNVRELENAINRLAIFATNGQITVADVSGLRVSKKTAAASAAPERLVEVEREHIMRVLRETHGNKAEAARRLGIERKTLYSKARRLGIDLRLPEHEVNT